MFVNIYKVIQQLSAMYTEASKLSTRLHSVITNKTILWAFAAIKISNSIAHTHLMSQHVTEERGAAKVRAICLILFNLSINPFVHRLKTTQIK